VTYIHHSSDGANQLRKSLVGPLIVLIALEICGACANDSASYLHCSALGTDSEHVFVCIGGSMRARAKLPPGQPGTKALVKIYGDQLVCVRYRYDRARRKRYKTVERIVDEAAWEPPHQAPDPATRVYMRVAGGEASVAHRIKAAGGQWHREYKRWSLPYGQVAQLALLDRLTDPEIEEELGHLSTIRKDVSRSRNTFA
jgi:hypothetical protein